MSGTLSTIRDQKPQTTSEEPVIQLRWQNDLFDIQELDGFAFTVESKEFIAFLEGESASQTHDGEIVILGEEIPIQFRVRNQSGLQSRCGFYDLPIKTGERLLALHQEATSSVSDELHGLSYDELAEGKTTKVATSVSAPSSSGFFKKAIATTLLATAMLLIGGWILFLVRSSSTISVANSVMVGNYQAVNAPAEGAVLDVLVSVGDKVQPGQVLATIENHVKTQELELIETRLRRAKREAAIHQSQADQIESMMQFATLKIEKDLAVADADKVRVAAEKKVATSQLNRLMPLMISGNIPQAEYEETAALVASHDAAMVRQEAIIDALKLARRAAESTILVGDSTVSNPLSSARKEVELAQAIVDELTETRNLVLEHAKPIELVSPSAGTVYAIYRRPGDFMKVADESMALSLDEGGWATGHVNGLVATNIKPGQEVEIEIPSLDILTQGVVSGIGHRAVYGRGGYSADFRSAPDEVPIRVSLAAMEHQVPSGLRLEMTVRVHDHLATMKQWFNGILGKSQSEDVAALSKRRLNDPVQGQ